MANKILNLDLSKEPAGLIPIIYGRVGDEDMQKVTVNITNRDTAVDLTGYTITFEGVTNGGKSKVFDVEGVKATPEGLKKGSFDYLFPNESFSVSGRYETAYFSFIKTGQRDTTGDFDIIVNRNADIDAEEAETIITLYNELVEQLQTKTKDYLEGTDEKFNALDEEVQGFQALIDSYKGQVSDTAAAAIKVVNDALENWEVGNFYTKEESDERYSLKGEVSEGYSKEEADAQFASKTELTEQLAPTIPLPVANGQNLDELREANGVYLILSSSNATPLPNPRGWYYLEVVVVLKTGTGNLVLQRLTELVSNKLYLRTQSTGNGGTWGAWAEK